MSDPKRIDEQLETLASLVEGRRRKARDSRKAMFKGKLGRWVTIRHTHVFIPDDPDGPLPEWFRNLTSKPKQ